MGTIYDVNALVTVINMSGNYSITANFAFGPQYIPGVAAGRYHTLGLRCDGIVFAVGANSSGQCDVGGWDLIV